MAYLRSLLQRLEFRLPIHRLETFCDGVFAIAITLLIIEIHVPKVTENVPSALSVALLKKWPQYFAYFLSFVTIGIYWLNHHVVFKTITKTDHIFGLITLFFLMTITFLPFPTAVMGQYMVIPEHADEAVPFYLFGTFMCSLTWWASWHYAKRAGLIDPTLDAEYVRCMTNKYILSATFNAGLVGVSLLSPLLALIGATVVNLCYIIPPPPPKYVK